MISHKHKFIFLHIPKTGGTSIERALEPNVTLEDPSSNDIHIEGNTSIEGKHWRTIDYEQNFPELFHSYFKFMFIRNPWDRIVSRYEWRRLIASRRLGNKHAKKILNEEFKVFLQKQGIEMFSKWCYLDLMKGKNGTQVLDFVGRFENLQNDFDIVCDKIGAPRQELLNANHVKRKHYTEYYNNETREMVTRGCQRDIEYFGYQFGE